MQRRNTSKDPIRLCILATVPISIISFYGEQLDFLADSGFSVTVITSPDKSGNLANKYKRVHFEFIPMTRKITPVKDILVFFRILSLMVSRKFDIVQFSSPKAASIGALASFLCRVPVRLYLMWGIYYSGQTGIKRRLLKACEKVICCLCTHIAPDSLGNRDFAVEEGLCAADKISVIGKGSANGIDLSRYAAGGKEFNKDRLRAALSIPSTADVLVFVGRLRKDKGVNELIYAFLRLVTQFDNLYLVMIGPDEISRQPLDVVVQAAINLDPRIKYFGFQRNVEQYLAIGDIFVLPSYREGFGLVNLEASAMGLPVVSTDIPGPRDSVKNKITGLLVTVGSVTDLEAAIRRLLLNSVLRGNLGNAGKSWVVNFEQKTHWQKILEHRLTLLKERKVIN